MPQNQKDADSGDNLGRPVGRGTVLDRLWHHSAPSKFSLQEALLFIDLGHVASHDRSDRFIEFRARRWGENRARYPTNDDAGTFVGQRSHAATSALVLASSQRRARPAAPAVGDGVHCSSASMSAIKLAVTTRLRPPTRRSRKTPLFSKLYKEVRDTPNRLAARLI